MFPAGIWLAATIVFSPLASEVFLLEEASISTCAPVNVMASGKKLCSSLEQRVESNSEENINAVLVGDFMAVSWKQPLTFLCVHSLYSVWEYISSVHCQIQRLTQFASLTPVSEILWKTWLSCVWWNTLVSKKICCYYCSFKKSWIPDDECKLFHFRVRQNVKYENRYLAGLHVYIGQHFLQTKPNTTCMPQ